MAPVGQVYRSTSYVDLNSSADSSGTSSGATKTSRGSFAIPRAANAFGSQDGSKASRAGSLLAAALSLHAVQIPFDELEINEVLGEGAFGIVSKGRWRGSDVAVKQMKIAELLDNCEALNEAELVSFGEEAQLMARLRPHAHICTFIGVSMDKDKPVCIVLEYLGGGTLLHFLRSDAKFSYRSAVEMTRDIASGVSHLHKENIIHRDLAARNVLLSSEQVAKVCDFGMSRAVSAKYGQQEGKTKATVGPLRWMPPESISRRVFSPKSDMWAMGVLVIEMLTRSQPYKGTDAMTVALLVQRGQLKPEFPESTPQGLVAIVGKCFEFEPANRPSADDMVGQLNALLNSS